MRQSALHPMQGCLLCASTSCHPIVVIQVGAGPPTHPVYIWGSACHIGTWALSLQPHVPVDINGTLARGCTQHLCIHARKRQPCTGHGANRPVWMGLNLCMEIVKLSNMLVKKKKGGQIAHIWVGCTCRISVSGQTFNLDGDAYSVLGEPNLCPCGTLCGMGD